jgi:UDP-N-acetylglucosamine 2-epimerase
VVLSAAGGVIVHAAGDCEDVPRLAGAAWALADTGAFDQLVVDACTSSAVARALSDLAVPAAVRRLQVAGASDAQRLGALEEAMRDALVSTVATAVMVHDDGDASLAAALAAARQPSPLVYVAGATRRRGRRARVIACLADLVLVAEEDDVAEFLSWGVAPERLRVVGDPLADAMRRVAARRAWQRCGVRPRRYVFAAIGRSDRPEVPAALIAMAERCPTVVSPSPVVAAAWCATGSLAALKASRARLAPWHGCVERLALAGAAGAVVTDSERLLEAAALAGVPGIDAGSAELEAIAGLRPRAPRDVLPLQAGRAGRRIAETMVANFARIRLGG